MWITGVRSLLLIAVWRLSTLLLPIQRLLHNYLVLLAFGINLHFALIVLLVMLGISDFNSFIFTFYLGPWYAEDPIVVLLPRPNGSPPPGCAHLSPITKHLLLSTTAHIRNVIVET